MDDDGSDYGEGDAVADDDGDYVYRMYSRGPTIRRSE